MKASVVVALAVTICAVVLWMRGEISIGKQILRGTIKVLALKESFFPSDDVTLSSESRALTSLFRMTPAAPHDVLQVRKMMDVVWKSLGVDDLRVLRQDIDQMHVSIAVISRRDRPGGLFGSKQNLVMLYLHAGGLIAGSFEGEYSLIQKIVVETGIPVVAVDYRLLPEATLSQAVEDVAQAYVWILEQFKLQHQTPRIVIQGASAGGCLALLSALYLRKDFPHLTQPQLLAMLSPAPLLDLLPPLDEYQGRAWNSLTANVDLDMFMKGGFYQWVSILVSTEENVGFANRLLSDLSQLPPSFLSVGGYEVILDGVRHLATMLHHHHIPLRYFEYPKTQHCIHSFWEFVPEGQTALTDLLDWIASFE